MTEHEKLDGYRVARLTQRLKPSGAGDGYEAQS